MNTGHRITAEIYWYIALYTFQGIVYSLFLVHSPLSSDYLFLLPTGMQYFANHFIIDSYSSPPLSVTIMFKKRIKITTCLFR